MGSGLTPVALVVVLAVVLVPTGDFLFLCLSFLLGHLVPRRGLGCLVRRSCPSTLFERTNDNATARVASSFGGPHGTW